MLFKRSLDCRYQAAAAALGLMLSVAAVAAGDFAQTTAFTAGEEGYFGFRIPTIVQAANGDLLAIVEGRVNSLADQGDIDLVMKRSTDNGATWGPMQLIRSEGTNTAGNPAPVLDRSTDRASLSTLQHQSERRPRHVEH